MTVLTWFDNLAKDEIPPEHLWEDTKGLELWWADVQERRDRKYGTSTATDNDDRDSAPELAENDLARAFRDR